MSIDILNFLKYMEMVCYWNSVQMLIQSVEGNFELKLECHYRSMNMYNA